MEARSNASNPDYHESDAPRTASVLEVTSREDFVRCAKRAESEALDALEAARDMLRWVERLTPYFERNPDVTVAGALQLYLADHPKAPLGGVGPTIT